MSVPFRLTYDPLVDAAYLYLQPKGGALGPTLLLESDPAFPGFVAMDFRLADGQVVGFEFHGASRLLPAALLAAAERPSRP